MASVRAGRLPRADRERLMLEVAAEEFARRGYGGVSMGELARRAGVTKPMLYAYFGSKEGLYAACVRGLVEPLIAQVRAAIDPEAPPDRQLWAGILAQLTFIDQHRDEWRVFVREAVARGGEAMEELRKGRRQLTELLVDLIERAIAGLGRGVPARKEIEAQAHAFQGAVATVVEWWDENPQESPEAVALRVMNFTWQGFGDILEGNLWIPPLPT